MDCNPYLAAWLPGATRPAMSRPCAESPLWHQQQSQVELRSDAGFPACATSGATVAVPLSMHTSTL
jgi:hypothetical protein